jgi:hypothetical protein
MADFAGAYIYLAHLCSAAMQHDYNIMIVTSSARPRAPGLQAYPQVSRVRHVHCVRKCSLSTLCHPS